MSKNTVLTPSLRGWQEHLRRAERQGVTLVQYARAAGVSVGSLYEAKRQLALRSMRAQGATPVASAVRNAPFVPVQVVSPPCPSAAVCRLRSPRGWLIECAEWPPGSWLARVIGGGAHDSP